MEHNSNILTSFNFATETEPDNEGLLSKLYEKVRTVVSNTGANGQEEVASYLRSDDSLADEAYLHSSLFIAETNPSDLSNMKQYTPHSHSMENMTPSLHDSLKSDSDYTVIQGPTPTLSSSAKAPPTASLATAVATAQTSTSTSTASSLGESSSTPHDYIDRDTEQSHQQKQCQQQLSSTNDHIRFSSPTLPSSVETASTASYYLGNHFTLPMTKSKSIDSDTQSVATNFSISNTNSLGRIMARLRGQRNNKEFWMPDDQCKECYKCRRQFTMFRRKHHCRFCGQIFCSKCASHIIPGKLYNQKGQVRICNFCYTEQPFRTNRDTPAPRLLASSAYEPTMVNDTLSNPLSSDEPYEPVIPSQNPPLAAPMMQIPTTAVKKSSNTKYGNENSTTVALEVSDHHSLSILGDPMAHSHQYHRRNTHSHLQQYHHHASGSTPTGTASTPPQQQMYNGSIIPGESLVSSDADSGGLKKLLDAGTYLLNPRSRSNTTSSLYPDDSRLYSQRASDLVSPSVGGHPLSHYMDHGGGTVVTENALSHFSCQDQTGNADGKCGIDANDRDIYDHCDGWHRPNSALGAPISRHSSGSSYHPFRHGQLSSSSAGKPATEQISTSAAGSDNESYDMQLRAKRTAELRGSMTPLRKRSYSSLRRQSTSYNHSPYTRKDRSGRLQINTSNLPRSDSYDNGSPDTFLYPYSAGVGMSGSSHFLEGPAISALAAITPTTPRNLATVAATPSSSTSVALMPPLGYSNNKASLNIISGNNVNNGANGTQYDQQLTQSSRSKLWSLTRHRRISAPTANVELSYSALRHARKLLRQLMDETAMGDLDEAQKLEWENAIMKLLLKIADHVQPDVRAGDDMDVRHYVKIKKIPGGLPSDSFYVKGVMCSKNVAHKRMMKNISEPRILILLFSLDYSRVEMGNQLLSIKPVISQEREHISKLVGRIVALRPSLLLVKSTVSRLALEILLEANITVVHNVKYSVIEAVARCTQASVVPSVDKLRGDISFGQCGSFETRTYLHEWIPNRRKTLLLFDDCPPELGGTIVLRGGTDETLQIVKRVTDFMVYVVHNLKLETALLRDSFAKNRGLEQSQIVASKDSGTSSQSVMDHTDKEGLGKQEETNSHGDIDTDRQPILVTRKEKSEMNSLNWMAGSDALQSFLKVYHDTILSVSQYVVFPPPFLLTRLKENQDKLATLKRNEIPPTPSLGNMPAAVAVSPTRSAFDSYSGQLALRGHAHSLTSSAFNMTGTHYELLLAEQHQLNRAWDAYVRDSPDYISPFFHQNIVVLYSNVCTVTTMPCYGPQIRVFEYYRYPSDIPLGQYLMDLFTDALAACRSPMCDHPTMNHYLSYAHGNARVNVITQKFECPVAGMNDKLLMWSYCKECKKATQVARVSEGTWNYSFGKFLELFLYQQGVHCRADICPHEIGRNHVRFFGYLDLSVEFQYEPIDLLEVAAPPTKLFMLKQVQIDLKEAERKQLRTIINKFYQSIIERNKAFPYDLVDPQQLDECKAELEELSDRSMGTKKKVLQILQNIYANTAEGDTLTINWVRRILYQEVAEWEMEYTELVRHYLLPERELRKITASQIRKMFPTDTSYELANNDTVEVERTKRLSETTDLPLLGIALDGDDEKTLIGSLLKDDHGGSYSLTRTPSMLPVLSSSPSDSVYRFLQEMNNDDDDQVDGHDVDKDDIDGPYDGSHHLLTTQRRFSLLQPSVRRRLSRELNRELQLRFRASDDKDERQSPSSYMRAKSPGPTTAAMTPSRIPIPNINISSTSRPQLSPPIYDPLTANALNLQSSSGNNNAKLILSGGGNKIFMAPLRVPSSFELNVSTPKLRLPVSKEIAHRNISGNERRIYVPNESRICLPANDTPAFMQQLQQDQKQFRQQDRYQGSIQTQSLQHIPSMFKSQYANSDSGRRALGSIRRGTTVPSGNPGNNDDIGAINGISSTRVRQQGQFKSRLPRKKTYIQVYTQANDLVKEDMDDEFLVSDLDDFGGHDRTLNAASRNNDDYSMKQSLRVSPSLLRLPCHEPVMDLKNLTEDGLGQIAASDEPIDYFSPQAPYSGASVVSPSIGSSTNKARINESVAAALASVARSPLSLPPTMTRPISMLERLDTDPSTDSGGASTEIDNQLPLASELLSSPAATTTTPKEDVETMTASSTTLNQIKMNDGKGEAATEDRPAGKLPRNALLERSIRRTLDAEEVKQQPVEKVSFMKTITSFLTDTGTGNLLPLELPLNPMEHVLPDSFVIVREDEPSSIIAYTLSCDDYLKKMKEMRDATKATDTNSLSDDNNTITDFFDDITLDQSISGTPAGATASTVMTAKNHSSVGESEMTQTQIQETLLRESGSHMRYNFSDGTTKFFCKTFFTEQFDALRRQCGCSEGYILSLASCIKWDPVGGKSGSAFLKTKDDRFLMKQLSRFELDAFLGFAPAYFQYLSKAFFTELPTVLAKIFGFYSIGYKNSSTGKSMRMDVLVMENLFYQRNVKKIFDLKGSMRNRHVESTGKEDEVLLDENLVEFIFQSPLFIRAHSKEILRSSLHNDTLFLSSRNVMDYSLLVGIDEERHELVVGIVDFIRTFTWDKKLESWVKESVFLGGGNKEPTIVSPRLYRLRFRAAMERYFLLVPDWTQKL